MEISPYNGKKILNNHSLEWYDKNNTIKVEKGETMQRVSRIIVFALIFQLMMFTYAFSEIQVTDNFEDYMFFESDNGVSLEHPVIGFVLTSKGEIDVEDFLALEFSIDSETYYLDFSYISDADFYSNYGYQANATDYLFEVDLTELLYNNTYVLETELLLIEVQADTLTTLFVQAYNQSALNGFEFLLDNKCAQPVLKMISEEPFIYNEQIEFELNFDEDVVIDVNRMEYHLASGDWRKDIYLVEAVSPRKYIVACTFDSRENLTVSTSVEFGPNSVLDNAGNSYSGDVFFENETMSYRAYYPEMFDTSIGAESIDITFKDYMIGIQNWTIEGFLSDTPIVGPINYGLIVLDTEDIEYDSELYQIKLKYSQPFLSSVQNQDKDWYIYLRITDHDGNVITEALENIELDFGPPVVILDRLVNEAYKQYLPFEVIDSNIELIDATIKTIGTHEDLCKIRLWYRNIENRSLVFDDAYKDNYTKISQSHIIGNLDTEEISAFMEFELSKDPLTTGTYDFVVTARDVDGRDSEPVSMPFTLDQSAPELFITPDESTEILEKIKVEVRDLDGHIPSKNRDFKIYYDFVLDPNDYVKSYSNILEIKNNTSGFITIPYNEFYGHTRYLVCYTEDIAGNTVTELLQTPIVAVDNPEFTIAGELFTNDLILDLDYVTTSTNLEYRASVHAIDQAPIFADDWKLLDQVSLALDLENEGPYRVSMVVRMRIGEIYLESEVESYDFIYDITPPTAKVLYSETGYTLGPVTAELINIEDNYSTHIDAKLRGSDQLFCTLHTPDEIWTYELTDEAGNMHLLEVQADWISTTARKAYAVYDNTLTDASIELSLEYVEGPGFPIITEPYPVLFENNKFIISENGRYVFHYVDDLGETGLVSVLIDTIDLLPPEVTITYSPEGFTNQDVTAFVEFNEQVSISNINYKVGEVFEVIFTENNQFTYVARDQVGHETVFELKVSGIDDTSLELRPSYSDSYYETSTKDPVIVTFTANKPFEMINNLQKKSREFIINDSFTFVGQDMYGNKASYEFTVSNINTKADVQVTIAPELPTNGDVTVTLESDEDITVLYSNNPIIASENMSGHFYVKDSRNNMFEVPFDVRNIDKTPPVITFDTKTLYFPVSETLSLPNDFEIVDNFDGVIEDYSLSHNINPRIMGTYYIDYTFQDSVGNSATVRRDVLVTEELTVVINGRQSIEGLMTIDSLDLSVQILNTEGDFILKYFNGQMLISDFKSNNQKMSNSLKVQKNGYITLYLLDQERNSKFIELYLYE